MNSFSPPITEHLVSKKKKLLLALLLSIIFFLIEFVLVHFHEPWSDESHCWAVATSSHSITQLLYNKRYDGHPDLWYILLYIVQLFTHNIFYMQVMHVFIAACTVFVFCFFSPFPFWKNTLICSGYFFAYEYSIISRNYGIELLLLFLCAGLYTVYKQKYLVLISLLFFLLFETNVYAVIIGVPFYCYILWNLYKSHFLKQKTAVISSALVLAGIIISIISIEPPGYSAFNAWYTKITLFDFEHVLTTVFTVYFPVPEFTMHFWSTNILDTLSQSVLIESILSLLLLLIAVIMFKANKRVLFLYCIGTFGLLLFTYIKNFGWIRHHGHLYILFLLCYWLLMAENKATEGSKNDKAGFWLRKYIIPVLFLAQIISAIFANVGDVKYIFSNESSVADYLKEKSLDTLPILGDADYQVSGIAGIMDKDIYYMRPKYWGRFITLDSNWGFLVPFSEKDMLYATDKISEQKKSDIIVILTDPFNCTIYKNWIFLKSYTESILGDTFYVYKVTYTPKI